jgi:hypothetical protein
MAVWFSLYFTRYDTEQRWNWISDVSNERETRKTCWKNEEDGDMSSAV